MTTKPTNPELQGEMKMESVEEPIVKPKVVPKIYCQFVDANVPLVMVGEFCPEHIENGVCKFCMTSPQITEYHVDPLQLMANISKK